MAADFGARVRALRTEAGYTQEHLAERTALHPTYISNVERGYSAPTLWAIVKLAQGLDRDPADLVQGLRLDGRAP